MGSSGSKPTTPSIVSQKALDASPQFIAPDGIISKIKGLGEVIGFFNDNDTSSLTNFIDVYNQKVSAKDKIVVGPEIKTSLLSFHNQMLEVIDQQMGMVATSTEKQEALKAKLKDNRQLNEMLKMYYNQKLQDIETRVLNDEMVKNSSELSNTVKIILNNVKALNVKYKFFEYKYIQLNLFMIVFVQYVYNSMTKFIVDVIAYNQARDAVRQEMTSRIFKATQQIMGASQIELKPQDANAINQMIANLQEKIQKDQNEIQDLSSRLKNNSMSDLLNFILTSDETLASHVMGSVDKYRQERSISQPSTPTPQQPQQPKQQPSTPTPPQQQQPKQQPPRQQQPQPPKLQQPPPQPQQPTSQPVASPPTPAMTPNVTKQPNATPATTPNATKQPNATPTNVPTANTSQQTGGFIRDMSILPQAFYNLKSA